MTVIRQCGSSLLPVAAVWAVLIAFGFWRDADWPGTVLHVWGTLAVVASFLLLVSTLMLRRMHGWDWLTVSLAAAFAAISLMPFYLMAARMWPAFFADHRTTLLYLVCAGMVVPLAFAVLMLLFTEDGSYAAEQRAEGVIEGHAAGVADEQADQRAREAVSE